jgi:ABC-type transporter Mla MlaB component
LRGAEVLIQRERRKKGALVAVPELSRTARVRARAALDEPGTVVLVLSGAITPDDVPSLCAHARALLEGTVGESIVCDVEDVVEPDAATVDALARLQVTARRLGCEVRALRAPLALRRLIELMGLSGVVPAGPSSDVEARREAEHREQPGGVQEERDPGDPVA